MWLVASLIQSDYRILWSLLSLERIQCYLSFLHGVSHQVKVASETTTFDCVWPIVSFVESECSILWSSVSLRLPLMVGCDQFFLSSNQIVGFFDHQFLWKELIDILVFLHGVSHQGKIAPEITSGCGWMWSVLAFCLNLSFLIRYTNLSICFHPELVFNLQCNRFS